MVVPSASLAATNPQQLFSTYADRLFQIRVIEKSSQRKSTIGSGFQISANGLVATNYHVISKYVQDPDRYFLQAISSKDKIESVTVEDIDVVHDLALVRFKAKNRPFLKIRDTKSLRKGDPIYSMGNPLDLGTAVVPGTYNGFTKQSYYQLIHFTGAINSGMSGGPVINNKGEVIGVNVATAGNQVGFLITADKLLNLLNKYRSNQNNKMDFQKRIHKQLIANQKKLMDDTLAAKWKTVKLGDASIVNELAPFIPCWGDKSRKRKTKKEKYLVVSIQCRQKEQIYINSGFRTGNIGVQYKWIENISLTPLQFSQLLGNSYSGASMPNRATETDVTEFSCHESFIKDPDERAVFCTRAYRKYPGLYDVIYVSTSINHNDKGLIRHFTLSGFEQNTAKRFLKRFLEIREWN